MCITMFCMAKAMSALPVGFAYSTYSGLTVTGVLLFAMLKYNQVPNLYGIIGIVLISISISNPLYKLIIKKRIKFKLFIERYLKSKHPRLHRI